MARVTDAVKEQVRQSNDILDVIGSVLPLKRAGGSFVALCPFHKEKSPSFHVNPARQIFHCFGCGKGGDVYRFIQEFEGLNFMEALERLAERARIPLEFESSPEGDRQRSLKEQLFKLHEAVCRHWQESLAKADVGLKGREYLKERGVAPEAIEQFRIGVAPEAWDNLIQWARAKGWEVGLLEQAGLVIQREGGGHYDRFRGRLMFPICDEQGRVVAFSGRILNPEETGGKYINSPETLLFTKGRVLYALDKARRAIADAGYAVLCEGQLDVIACHAAGIKNVVAPQGTALTQNQARLLRRYAEEVVLCFDGDKAGQAAIVKAMDGCLGSGLAIRVASVPPPDDPDSFIRKSGSEAFQELLGKAEGFFDFLLRYLCELEDPATDRGRSRIVRSMGEKLRQTGNAVLEDTYAQRTAQRLSVSAEAIRREFAKVPKAKGPGRAGPEGVEEAMASVQGMDGMMGEGGVDYEEVEESMPGPLELALLERLIQAGPEVVGWVVEHLDPNWLLDWRVRNAVDIWLHLPEPDVGRLLDALSDDPMCQGWVTRAATVAKAYPELETQLADTVRRLRDAWIDRQLAATHAELSDPETGEDKVVEILMRQKDWRIWKRRPLEPLGEV